jgi:hypothetical protein
VQAEPVPSEDGYIIKKNGQRMSVNMDPSDEVNLEELLDEGSFNPDFVIVAGIVVGITVFLFVWCYFLKSRTHLPMLRVKFVKKSLVRLVKAPQKRKNPKRQRMKRRSSNVIKKISKNPCWFKSTSGCRGWQRSRYILRCIDPRNLLHVCSPHIPLSSIVPCATR